MYTAVKARPTPRETFNKVFDSQAEWVDKDEILDVVYWGRQVLAFIIGIILGFWPVANVWGLIIYAAVTALTFNHYVMTFLERDADEMGGFWGVAKEGFGSAFATFMVLWITVYTVYHH